MTKTEPREDGRQTYRLGIDLGSGSVGWAAVAENENGEALGLLGMGVRRFEAGVSGDIESGRDESRATARRDARSPRRLTWRRQYRLRKVFRLLQKWGLLPPSEDDSHDERHRVLARLDRELRDKWTEAAGLAAHQVLPYLLRARALDGPLAPDELGRALYHLAQRRGFLSNLKAAKKDEDAGVVKKEIGELAEAMEAAGARTLGEYFAALDPEEVRIRRRHTARAMYEREFEQIWTAQTAHHADLTADRKEKLREAIFFQRPLKSQKGLIGMCPLEKHKHRAPAACLAFQEFRILQKVNDLEVIEPDSRYRKLGEQERAALLEELANVEKITFGGIRKLFKMRKSKEYGRNFTFNFEDEGEEKHLVGNRTAAKMVDLLGDRWREMPPEKQRELVDDVLSFESEGPLVTRLTRGWGLDETLARQVAQTPLEPGYASHSRKAIGKLLPAMRQGVRYATAKKDVYGDIEEKTDPLDFLPAKQKCALLRDLRNPAVARALSELRKVVNALIRRYGRPREIHVELARDLKHARKMRQKLAERNRRNRSVRDDAAKRIVAEMKDERYRTPRNILKVRLADECNWECPYSGKTISMQALVGDSPQFEIEHIIPFSRSLDNSFYNKTLCAVEENRRKGNRTPYEAYHGTEQWEEILGRVRRIKGDAQVRRRKLELFQTEKLPDTKDFTNRQLTDTRYMSRLAAEYLGTLFGGQIDAGGRRRVLPSPGRVTHYLRDLWGLNAILGREDEKSRDDHRHHAIDALVVALVGPWDVNRLSRAAEEAEELRLTRLFPRGQFDPPWEGFAEHAARAVAAIHVSSRPSRKLGGKLHKETVFSKPIEQVDDEGNVIAVRHHVRKHLSKLSAHEVADIVDDRIRWLVQEKLEKLGATPDKAFADESNHPYMRAKDGRIIPIHKVRIRRGDKPIPVGRGTKTRYVNPGSNHHMEIVAVLDKTGREKKWTGERVSRMEAVTRYEEARRRGDKPEIVRKVDEDGRKFKFSLAGGEHVVMDYDGQGEKLYRVKVISDREVELVLHNDARTDKQRREDRDRVRCTPDKLRKCGARKVTVDPLGNVFPAND